MAKDFQIDGIKFSCTKEEDEILAKIVKRALAIDPPSRREPPYTGVEWAMDIEATHSNGCPLDLQKLLDAPSFDFAHDVFGIREHLDRTTGKLMHCFLPRCSKPQA